jgi:hypothetical protein
MSICHICGVPADAGYFDTSRIIPPPEPGAEKVLARYELHRNYCGLLLHFAQLVETGGSAAASVQTPGFQWQIRCNGQPRDPYLSFDHIINPWGSSALPVNLRLEEGCVLELVIRNVQASTEGAVVGGRLVGRYWYNDIYGGAPGRL